MYHIRTYCQATSEPGDMMSHSFLSILMAMDFPERLTQLRKSRGMTQQALADKIGVHLSQLKRYEGGTSQPTLDVLRNTAIALGVSADVLLFDKDEREPKDDDLRYRFETIARFSTKEKQVVKEVLDGLILSHQAKELQATR